MKSSLSILLLLTVFSSFAQQPTYATLSAKAKSYEREGRYEEAISLYRRAATLDSDTMLNAASAYFYVALIYKYQLEDSVKQKEAEAAELYCINKSLEKYPDNIDAYLYRIRRYKYSNDQKERAEFIQRAEARFPDRWELTLTIAYSYILYDFPWPEVPNHDICMKYLKRTLELNPQEFNTMLLLTVAVGENVVNEYLKKMYALHPEAFSKNTEASDVIKYPYKVTTIRTPYSPSDAYVSLTPKQCKMLGLIK